MASTATSDMRALTRSSRPAFGSRYSGRTIGPRTSRSAHHRQRDQEDRAPPELLEQHARRRPARWRCPPRTPRSRSAIALARSPGSWNMLKISDRVDGAIVAPAMPSSARLAISISGLDEMADRIEIRPKAPAPTSSSLRRPTRSPTRTHRHEEPGHREPVDVDDPQELGAARTQVPTDRRHGQVQDREVHDVDECREGEHGESYPLAPACLGWTRRRRHRFVLMAPTVHRPPCPFRVPIRGNRSRPIRLRRLSEARAPGRPVVPVEAAEGGRARRAPASPRARAAGGHVRSSPGWCQRGPAVAHGSGPGRRRRTALDAAPGSAARGAARPDGGNPRCARRSGAWDQAIELIAARARPGSSRARTRTVAPSHWPTLHSVNATSSTLDGTDASPDQPKSTPDRAMPLTSSFPSIVVRRAAPYPSRMIVNGTDLPWR